ncbi:MAG: DUF3887 domain-containing protein [Lachnospiraceae bacterium]|nr:DUF3887 domain-containing protein [Lachnospiraceae bacterium]
MKGKLYILLAVLGVMTAALSGCKKEGVKEETVSEGVDVTQVVTPTVEPTKEPTKEPTIEPTVEETASVFDADALLEQTKQYARDMAAGEFGNVFSAFSLSVKAQVPESTLKSSYESVVAPLGDYIGIYSGEADIKEDYANVYVVSEYENNGLILSVSYNTDLQIRKINLNYYTLNKEVQNSAVKEVDIQIGDPTMLLDGKLTLPVGVENPPVVILVQGSGQSDMDETIGATSNKPFRDIAYGLAERGIASIRYNKRYYQYPELAGNEITIYDEVLDDVGYAIEFAKVNTLVDGERLFIAGHSLGGMLCPKIASDHKEVIGFISLAGSPRRLEEIIYDQNMKILETMDNVTEEYKESVKAELEQMIATIQNLDESTMNTAILGATGYYWNSLEQIDTKELVKNLTIPMLFLQGSADFQVYADVDFVQWQKLLAGHDNAKFKLYANLNHLFMESQGLSDTTEYDVMNHVSDTVIADIAQFVLDN